MPWRRVAWEAERPRGRAGRVFAAAAGGFSAAMAVAGHRSTGSRPVRSAPAPWAAGVAAGEFEAMTNQRRGPSRGMISIRQSPLATIWSPTIRSVQNRAGISLRARRIAHSAMRPSIALTYPAIWAGCARAGTQPRAQIVSAIGRRPLMRITSFLRGEFRTARRGPVKRRPWRNRAVCSAGNGEQGCPPAPRARCCAAVCATRS